MSILESAEREGRLQLANSVEDLVELAAPPDQLDQHGYFTVGYDIPERGFVPELKVCRVKNGISANYVEPYMRRRDPECMVIADSHATDKPTYQERFGGDFEPVRQEAVEWLRGQPIAAFFFETGVPSQPLTALAICPANAGFFALGLSMLQGIVPLDRIRDRAGDYHHDAVLYIVPPFRHTHFGGKQVVVHNRRFDETGLHELFSFNLYPGPSAKKGVYGMLLTRGERDTIRWTTAHCSTVQVITPYDNITTIMHEGASGGGKSEMLEHVHREDNGEVLLGRNITTGERRTLMLPRGCELNPVTDDMALCHPELQVDKGPQTKLMVTDAERAWFIRVNHIDGYGTDPHLERLAVNPPGPLLFLNIDAKPDSTALIWEHIQDAPDTPCPNPRLVFPREYMPGVVDETVPIDIRSFGVRCPPCTREKPTYGIIGLFHILPPSLAWLWRLVAPRGHGNPSIVDQGGMQSEGVGSYWPFATGRRVDQANILLDQIEETADTLFLLIPNQHIGAWEMGFAPQWIAREYLARRGPAPFPDEVQQHARCPLLGRHLTRIQVEGQPISRRFFDVAQQEEVGVEAYDQGAAMLRDFFHQQLQHFDHPELTEKGRVIVQACLDGASVADYDTLLGG